MHGLHRPTRRPGAPAAGADPVRRSDRSRSARAATHAVDDRRLRLLPRNADDHRRRHRDLDEPGPVVHTATSTTGAFDSGDLAAGRRRSASRSPTPGTYDYLCTPHPTMTGQIVVHAAAAATAAPSAAGAGSRTSRCRRVPGQPTPLLGRPGGWGAARREAPRRRVRRCGAIGRRARGRRRRLRAAGSRRGDRPAGRARRCWRRRPSRRRPRSSRRASGEPAARGTTHPNPRPRRSRSRAAFGERRVRRHRPVARESRLAADQARRARRSPAPPGGRS